MLRGTLVDSEGSPIRMAYIVIHDDGSGRATTETRADVTLRSDNRGRFSAELEPGFYDVCVMAQAFTPVCRKLLLRDKQPTNLALRLSIAPEVVKQLGDKF
jgi:hypothetical protein